MTHITPGVHVFRRSAAIASLALLSFAFAPAANAADRALNPGESTRSARCSETLPGGTYDPGAPGTTADDTCSITTSDTVPESNSTRVNNEKASKDVSRVEKSDVTYESTRTIEWVPMAGWKSETTSEPVETDRVLKEKCMSNPSGEHCKDA